MGSIFSPPAPKLPPPPPPLPTPEDPAIEEERRKRLISERLRKGRSSTILTSGLGDSKPADVVRPDLRSSLGGDR
jgi:hypothetical protein